MGNLTFAVVPDNTQLVSLAKVKSALNITVADDDTFLADAIASSTSMIEKMLGRPLVRAQYTETMRGSGRVQLALSVRPIVSIDAVSRNDAAYSDLSEFLIAHADAGLIYRDNAKTFDDWNDPLAWSITYTAGYFVADDDITSEGSVVAAATDDSYTLGSSTWPTHFAATDLMAVTGFADAADNGTHKTATVESTTKITVAEALADESPAGNVNFYVATLPGVVERAVSMLVGEAYHARERDPTLKSESIYNAWSATWEQNGTRGVSEEVRALLAPMRVAI